MVLLPGLLMLMHTVVETAVPEEWSNPIVDFALFLGQPIVALLLTVLLAILVFGVPMGDTADEISARVGGALGPIVGVLLIVGAGGELATFRVHSDLGRKVCNSWRPGLNAVGS
ncbi:hypothetical protein [Actinomyces ruminis]|uniref:GntT/GntP/DsdX family permease n=1 Tax=Actinomyces ruminis TaxID=1937003 RepID=UPI000B6FFD22